MWPFTMVLSSFGIDVAWSYLNSIFARTLQNLYVQYSCQVSYWTQKWNMLSLVRIVSRLPVNSLRQIKRSCNDPVCQIRELPNSF